MAFTHENLAEVMRGVLEMPQGERDAWRAKAIARVRERYSWDAVTDAYEGLLGSLTAS